MDDLVHIYLREIGRVPLLSYEQEIVYSKQVQQMMNLLEAKEDLAEKIRREPTLQEWAAQVQLSEVKLNETLQQGQCAKQKMVEGNLRLVVMVAKQYQKRHLEFLDLLQEGNIGLHRAVERFDPTRGYKFSSYAYWWIRQAITRAIADKGRTIRLPMHVIEKLHKIKNAQYQLWQQLGRAPTVSELAAKLELTSTQVRECLERVRLPLSLNLRVGDNQDTELSELLENMAATPEDVVVESSLSNDLERLISELNPQQQEVLALRFGLRDGQGLTLAKIGARLNISRERVRQVENQALKQLRRNEAMLQDYFIGSH